MRSMKWFRGTLTPAFVAVVLIAGGCDDRGGDAPAGTADTDAAGPRVVDQPRPATRPIIPVAQMADWCPEHQVPESICTRCNGSLIAGFKAKGDWDERHDLPKSQCFECDPSLKQKFAAAYKEKYGKEPPTGGEGESH